MIYQRHFPRLGNAMDDCGQSQITYRKLLWLLFLSCHPAVGLNESGKQEAR